MPKAVHIIGSKSLGGAERFCMRLIRALQERGENVTALVRNAGEVVAEMRKAAPTVALPMRTVWDPLSRWEVRRAIERIGPNIVQTYMGRATRLTRLAQGKGVVHVARLGGYYDLDGYRHAHAWIGNTRALCDYMVRGGLPGQRVFHIYNFVEPPPPYSQAATEQLRAALGIPGDALVLMTAGRFIPVKGHGDLLQAFARLPRSVHDRHLHLLMVGDGALRLDLRRLAASLGVEDRISWAGWKTEPSAYYHASDLVAFPSLERETLGNVILEAWAHAKPLVVTRFPGALEITRHGEDAWQAACGDAQELALGLLHVLQDEALAAGLARAGRARVSGEFSLEHIVSQYRTLYEELSAGYS